MKFPKTPQTEGRGPGKRSLTGHPIMGGAGEVKQWYSVLNMLDLKEGDLFKKCKRVGNGTFELKTMVGNTRREELKQSALVP